MPKTARKKSPPEPETTEMPIATETSVRPTEEQIAARAYQIYLERGGSDGKADDDWLQAERELNGTSEPLPIE
jgi:hypothetical protein